MRGSSLAALGFDAKIIILRGMRSGEADERGKTHQDVRISACPESTYENMQKWKASDETNVIGSQNG